MRQKWTLDICPNFEMETFKHVFETWGTPPKFQGCGFLVTTGG